MIQLPKHILQRRIFTEKSYSKVTNGSLTALENMDLLSKNLNFRRLDIHNKNIDLVKPYKLEDEVKPIVVLGFGGR